MIWKPVTLAAILVMAVGLAAGKTIGGKTKTVVVTATATATTAATPTGVPSDPTVAGTPEPTVTAEPTDTPGLSEPVYLTVDDIVKGDLIDGDIEAGVDAQLQLGPKKSDSVRFTLQEECCDGGAVPEFYTLELAVPDGAKTFQTTAGFAKGMPSGNGALVEFRRNEIRGEVLAGKKRAGTDTFGVNIPVAGVAKVILKISPTQDTWTFLNGSLSYVLREARFQ